MASTTRGHFPKLLHANVDHGKYAGVWSGYVVRFTNSVGLKKAMGCSHPSSFLYNKTAATVSKEAKEKIRNSLE